MLEALTVGAVSLFLGALASWAYSGFRIPARIPQHAASVNRSILVWRNGSHARVAA
jgi:hypothetical protein